MCSVVSAIFAQLSGPRGTDGRARTQRGSFHGGALGSALCRRIEQTDSSAPAPTRRFLAVDETYVRVAGRWTYLYRALDSQGNTIDFMLSPKRDLVAAKHFLQLALWRSAVRPRVINVDGHPAYAHAIAELKEAGELGPRCRCRTAPYLNNIVEQDHRFIKKRIAASLGFRSVTGAVNTIGGYEAMHMIRKGQVRWLAKGDVVGQVRFINQTLGIAA